MGRMFRTNCITLPVLLSCFIFMSNYNNILPSSAVNTVLSDKTAAAAKVSSKQVKSNSDTLNADIKIPVLSGMKNKSLEESLNEKFTKEALSFKDEIEKAALDFQKFAAEHKIPLRPFAANVSYNVTYNKNNLLSITFYYYSFTGGAHGSTKTVSYTVDLNSGKFLTLSDLFKSETNYKEKINEEIKKQMSTDGKPYFANGFKSISDSQDFYIEDDNIVVYFQQYEIAPYVTGIPEFKIPFFLFQEKLNPDINLN